jgi:hypothetical protein
MHDWMAVASDAFAAKFRRAKNNPRVGSDAFPER